MILNCFHIFFDFQLIDTLSTSGLAIFQSLAINIIPFFFK